MIGVVLITPASAISWTAGGVVYPNLPASILWSTGGNWSGGVPPATISPYDDVTFTNAGAVAGPAPTNEVAATTSINSLWYSQTDTAYVHTTQIDLNQTLKVQGFNATTPSGYVDKYSLYAGNLGTTATSVQKTVITGNGKLDVSGPSGENTTGDIIVTMGNATGGTTYPDHTAVLDLSGLATFNANVDQLLVGVEATGSSMDRPNGIMYLAASNTIVLNNATSPVAEAGGTSCPLPGGALVVGYSSGKGAGDTYICALYLGHTNTIKADYVLVGGRVRPAAMGFESKTDGSSMTLQGNSQSRVKSINIGDNTNNSTSGNATVGTVDLRGGSVNIMADSIVLGQTTTNYSGSNRQAYSATGTLSFDTGTIDSTGMLIANQATNLNAKATGTVNVSGAATLTIGANGLTMANYNGGYTGAYYGAIQPATATLNVSGGTVTIAGGIRTDVMNLNSGEYAGPNSGVTVASTINITGGSVTLGGDITKGVATTNMSGTIRTTVIVNGGTLDMQGPDLQRHNIGSSTSSIDTLTLANGTLKNVLQINGGGAITTTTTGGTLTISGTNTFTGATTVSAGKLLAEGSMWSFVTVNSGATLGGNGTLGDATHLVGLKVLGILAVGDSAGQMTVYAGTNDVTLAAGSNDNVEITGNAPGAAGYDQLLVETGNVSLAGALNLSATYTPNPGDMLWIIDNVGSGTLSGTFSNDPVPTLWSGWDIFYSADHATNSLSGGNDVVIAQVPEPATLTMLIIAAGLCLMFKRTRGK